MDGRINIYKYDSIWVWKWSKSLSFVNLWISDIILVFFCLISTERVIGVRRPNEIVNEIQCHQFCWRPFLSISISITIPFGFFRRLRTISVLVIFPFCFWRIFFLRRIPIAARASPRVPVEEGEEEGVGAATPLFSFLFPFRSQSTGDCPAVRSTPSTPRRLCLFVWLFACLFVGSFVGFGVAVGWLPSFAVAKSDGVPAVSLIFFFGAVWFFLFQVAYRPKLPEYRVLPNFFLRPKSASGVRVRVCLLGSFTEFKKKYIVPFTVEWKDILHLGSIFPVLVGLDGLKSLPQIFFLFAPFYRLTFFSPFRFVR